ncbi:unnamed protein product, partial [marine sediment metagenome]
VNFVGMTQVLSYTYDNSLKAYIDKKIEEGFFDNEHFRTTSIGQRNESYWTGWGASSLSEDERNEGIRNAIVELLGKAKVKKN